MLDLTADGLRVVTDVAQRHGVSVDAVIAVLGALAQGQGNQAQFNHPDLGGMGQWSQGGMIMVGDMFNQGLKYRVDALCSELAGLLRNQPLWNVGAASFQSQSQSGGGVSLFVSGSNGQSAGWPAELGPPASVGAQNDLRYAYFPGPRRLAIQQSGRLRVYDSGEHRISGFSQQQSGDQSLTFTSQFGVVRVADLPPVAPRDEPSHPPPPPIVADPPRSSPLHAAVFATPPAAPVAPPPATGDVFTTIERLAELRQKNIITEEEFSAKKAELLSRL